MEGNYHYGGLFLLMIIHATLVVSPHHYHHDEKKKTKKKNKILRAEITNASTPMYRAWTISSCHGE